MTHTDKSKAFPVPAGRMLPAGTFQGQTALVTGGGTGLGFGIAQELRSLGANVVIASRSEDHLGPAAEILDKTGAAVLAKRCDVRNPDDVKALVSAAMDKFGRIDLLVNNAAGNFICPLAAMSPNAFGTVIDIVLKGTFNVTRFVGEKMIAHGKGSILCIGATYAWHGGPGTAHSAAAKAGVHSLTQSLAVEWGPLGIRTNTLVPGPVDTEGAGGKLFPSQEMKKGIEDRTPTKRLGTEIEVARLAAYLLSDYASWFNGAIVTMDGGLWLNNGQFAALLG